MTYKEIDLFGGETVRFIDRQNGKKKNLFTDHDAFVEKFEVKKTTDDCYTPKEVFNLILGYVNENCDLSGKKIIRPFFPVGKIQCYDMGVVRKGVAMREVAWMMPNLRPGADVHF